MSLTTGKRIMAGLREYFNFQIFDDCIESRGRQIFFLRIHPKNMSILSPDEKKQEIKKLQNFLDAADVRISIFVTDKTENLNEISEYYREEMELRPEYSFVIEPVIKRIMSIEKSSACIQRAFYIIVKVKNRREYETIENQLSGRLDFSLAQKEELILVMRNYILREYTMFSLYVFENAVRKHFEEYSRNTRRNRHVEVDPIHEAKEDNRAAIDRIFVTDGQQQAENKKEIKAAAIHEAVASKIAPESNIADIEAPETPNSDGQIISAEDKQTIIEAAASLVEPPAAVTQKRTVRKRKTAVPRKTKAEAEKKPMPKEPEAVLSQSETADEKPSFRNRKAAAVKQSKTKEKEVNMDIEIVQATKKAKNDGGSLWPQS